MELTDQDVLLEPVVTEDSWRLQEEENKYVFAVHPDANKPQIKKAVQNNFNVSVETVTTLNIKGKPRRERLDQMPGTTSSWKKAYVRLSEGDRIDIFG